LDTFGSLFQVLRKRLRRYGCNTSDIDLEVELQLGSQLIPLLPTALGGSLSLHPFKKKRSISLKGLWPQSTPAR
jgi:hypothetical protein